MDKIINENKVSFNINGQERMSMYFLSDEFIWAFNDSEKISITKDMELYSLLEYIMNQSYTFSNDQELKDYKDNNKLIWYSDCYYNPDNDMSKKSVSYLTIERINDNFNIYCTKPLDEVYDRPEKHHIIVFSPAGNGKYSKNDDTGSSLQDDIVQNVYYKLLKKEKILNKKINNI